MGNRLPGGENAPDSNGLGYSAQGTDKQARHLELDIRKADGAHGCDVVRRQRRRRHGHVHQGLLPFLRGDDDFLDRVVLRCDRQRGGESDAGGASGKKR